MPKGQARAIPTMRRCERAPGRQPRPRALRAAARAPRAGRARDAGALYGADGVLPPDLARLLWDNRVALSPFTWVAAWPSLMWAGIALLAAAALCLALGVYPRLAALAAWGLLAALQERNPGLYMVWGSLSGLFQHGDLHARFGQTLGSGVACSR